MNTDRKINASFISRFIAYIIDLLLVMAFVTPINYLNITEYKNFVLFFVVMAIGILYKPLCELYYSKTLGKHLFKIEVRNIELTKLRFRHVIIRNVFFMLPSLSAIPFYFLAFSNPKLMDLDVFTDFASQMVFQYPLQRIIGNVAFVIILIDVMFLFFDPLKKSRALHDRIANTYVIRNK